MLRLTPPFTVVEPVVDTPITCISYVLCPMRQITINTTTYLALEGIYTAQFLPNTYTVTVSKTGYETVTE